MSSDFSPIRIPSVDDHPIIRQVVAGLVATRADMNLIAQAANGREAIQQCHRHCPTKSGAGDGNRTHGERASEPLKQAV